MATISINVVMGEDGIIKQAEKAGEHQLNAEAEENAKMDELDKYIANTIASTVKTIKFTVDGSVYTAEEGMTWDDFINSDYNVNSNFKYGENGEVTDSIGFRVKTKDNKFQYGNNTIEEGESYVLAGLGGETPED